MKVLIALLLTVCVVASGCGGSTPKEGAPPAASASAPAAEVKQYDIKGRIESISADRKTVNLDHEAIPGLMAAMKMDYEVASPDVLQGLAVGDRVSGRFEVRSGSRYVVTTLRK
jgi:Cu/Ag efflux protein CusF